MARKLTVSLERNWAMKVTRVSVVGRKLVYVILAERKQQYTNGKSQVVYIGTTQNGVSRVASSAADKTDKVLSLRGVRHFTVRIVTCAAKQNVKSWTKLERALILQFRELYGEVPKFNKSGKKIRETDEFKHFRRERIRTIVQNLDN